MLERLTGLLYPERCVSCGSRGAWLCPRCRPALQLIEEPLCERCGLTAEPGHRCFDGRRGDSKPVLPRRLVGPYQPPLNKAIQRLKFDGQRYLAKPLAALLGDQLLRHPLDFDLLAPVPLSSGRLRQRGYNQSALIAQQLGQLLGVPVQTHALRRLRETRPQMQLPREDRLHNLQGAFAVNARFDGRRVCIVDDVTTTGATLAACAEALRQAGAKSVCSTVIAYVP